MFKRFGLFMLTNLLVMVTVGIVWSIASQVLGMYKINAYIPVLMVMSLVLGMTGSLVSLMLSKFMAKTMYGVQIIDPNTTNPDLYKFIQKVHTLSRNAGLEKMPEIGIYESFEVNAFATGPSRNSALVAVSSGLLQRMTEDEIDGVLAHEVAHIANGDMVTMALIQGIVNSFAFFFSRVLAGIISSNVDEKARGMVHFIVTIIGDIAFTMLGSIVVCYYSRQREFRADAGGASFSSRQKMVAALKRLQTVHDIPSDPSLSQIASLKISDNGANSIVALFMTHPPLEQRIEALQSAGR